MRKLLAILMVLTMSLGAWGRDPGDAWPWGAEMPFPWKGIQGTWKAYVGDQLVYFTFHVILSSEGANQLEVVTYDGKTCAVLADGRGFEEGGKLVRGMINTPTSTLNMTIHVFSEAAMKASQNGEKGDSPRTKREKTYTVLNLSSMGEDKTAAYQLYKVHKSPTGICGAESW